jgi:hypothetical protein
MLHEKAFPNDKLISDKLPLTYQSKTPREQIAAIEPKSYQKGSGKPLKVSVIGTEIKICAPFFEMLQDIERESDFEIKFSFHLGTSAMDTLYAERYFKDNFKNCEFHGWQPYEVYLQSMQETDIILNPFPFGHTNTLIDTLIMGKPLVGLEGHEPASRTELMILEEVGLRDQFSATSIEDYKQKFYDIATKILNGETNFYDRMEMFDKLHAPVDVPDYSASVKWIYENAQAMKSSSQKRFEVGEDFEGMEEAKVKTA